MIAKNVLIMAALLCCTLDGAAQDERPNRASRASGEAAYMRVGCYTCHGTVGQGGAAKPLAPNTLPLEAFGSWVRRGSPDWSITRGMPAFPEGVVSDEELADVRAFLAGLPPPAAVEDIPALNELAR